jgi:hypothetical protein
MNCLEYQQLLQERLDGVWGSDGSTEKEHLASCPACRSLQAAARQLEKGLQLFSSPTPPPGLRARLISSIWADRRQRQQRQGLLAVAAIAASVLILVLVYSWHEGSTKIAGVKPAPESPSVPPPSLQQNMNEVTLAMSSLTKETVEQGRRLLPEISLTPAGEGMLVHPLEPPAQSLREAGQGVVTSLEPVTTSARRALNLFLRDLPPGLAETKPNM